MGRFGRFGFTLIELMVVIGIMAIIASIAIPTLFSSRKAAQIGATQAILHTICTAEQAYYTKQNVYGDFPTLSGAGLLDSRFNASTVTLNAYSISIVVANGNRSFVVTATPLMSQAPTMTVDETFRIVES